MKNYHIDKNGDPTPCKAQAGNCLLGDSTGHSDNKTETTQEAERSFTEAVGILAATPLYGADTSEVAPPQTRTQMYQDIAELEEHLELVFKNEDVIEGRRKALEASMVNLDAEQRTKKIKIFNGVETLQRNSELIEEQRVGIENQYKNQVATPQLDRALKVARREEALLSDETTKLLDALKTELKLAKKTEEILKRFNNPNNMVWSDLDKY